MQHHFSATYKNIRVRPLAHKDIEFLRNWRNNKDETKYIRQLDYITPEMQEVWFQSYLKDEDNYTFAIDEIGELNRCVGSVSLYNFRGDTAESGKFMVGDPDARGKGVGRLGITLCLHFGFEKLGMNVIDAVVDKDNIASLTTHQKAGFLITGEHPYSGGTGTEKELTLPKDHFYSVHDFLPEVVIEEV